MHFSTVLTAVLATAAAAAPNGLQTRAQQSVNNQAEAIVFAAEAADCSLISCAQIIANVACILLAIRKPGGEGKGALADCLKDGLDSVCPCAACVPGLGDFVTENNIC